MRIAVLLNSYAIKHDRFPLTYEDWSEIYRTFLQSSISAYNALHSTTITLQYRCFDVIEAQEYPQNIDHWDAILLTGGTDALDANIPWVTKLLDFIRAVVRAHHVKIIGICWGHQAIAQALDGDVEENGNGPELGAVEVSLSSTGRQILGASTPLTMQQLHRRVVTRLPLDFQSWGRSEKSAVQGMVWRDRVLTFQGHPEATEYMTRACLSCASHFGATALSEAQEYVAHDGSRIGTRVIAFILGSSFKHVTVHPALFNSSSPWSSTMEQLQKLYDCPSTGAVTTRTATMQGFREDHTHNHSFHESGLNVTSFNSYGFSPHPLNFYLDCIRRIYNATQKRTKPFIVSIGGSDQELCDMLDSIQAFRGTLDGSAGQEILVELNLSCPNIPSHPPPSYSETALTFVLQNVILPYCKQDPTLIIGLKVTPFTYLQQFTTFVKVLSAHLVEEGKTPVTYIAATNTLGGALPIDGHANKLLPGSGVGGMAGHAIHAISLGTVSSLSTLLCKNVATKHIKIIGIGGVCDSESYRHMKQVGANAVALATALGIYGTRIFDDILS